MKKQQMVFVSIFVLLLSACGGNAAETIAELESANQEWVAQSTLDAEILENQYATIEAQNAASVSLAEELENRLAEIEALNDQFAQQQEQLATAQAPVVSPEPTEEPTPDPALITCVNFEFFEALSFGYIKGDPTSGNIKSRPAVSTDDCLFISYTFGNGGQVHARLNVEGTQVVWCNYDVGGGEVFACTLALMRAPGEAPNLNAQGTAGNGNTICLAETKASYTGPCQ